jgi:hypothetical protein
MHVMQPEPTSEGLQRDFSQLLYSGWNQDLPVSLTRRYSSLRLIHCSGSRNSSPPVCLTNTLILLFFTFALALMYFLIVTRVDLE